MRPDRIVVGECRGGEALDMLQAMNTGHDGSMTTLHANDPAAAVDRLVVLAQMAAGSQLPVTALRRQIAAAVNLIVQLREERRDGRRVRVVSGITEVAGYDPEADEVRLVPLFVARRGDRLRPTGHLPTFLPDLIARGLVPDPVAFVRDPFDD
jgi:pilus assembly protein CpaF